MTATIEGYVPLPKESFIETEWLGPGGGVGGVSPRWQGYTAELPNRGLTRLYPLRESNFGMILPHIYADRMYRSEYANNRGNSPLGRLHRHVNALYDLNGSYDYDEPTSSFRNLLRVLDNGEYSESPELATNLKEVFEGYKDIREAQRTKVAKGLSRTISSHELYIVASDSTERHEPDDNGGFYAARLSGVISVRSDDRMNYHLLVRDTEDNEGFLPQSFSVPAGVTAPSA